MSERKVLNKYYPPDFDPSQIPRGKRNKNATFNIRIMAPFNMRCNMCKEYIYKGKKFNSRKEDVMDETYLGLRIFRFYIKCPRCVSEIAFKTDLEKTDYALEAGATRLFEAEKIAHQMAEQERKEREEDELNPMKVLENRTKASQQEMEQIDSLEELREINSKKNVVNTDEMIEKYRKYEEMLLKLQMEQEEEEIKEIFGEKGTMVVKRLNDSDSEGEEPVTKKPALGSGVKPTDILAQETSGASKTKQPAVWEKSVGSLAPKSSLKGLVVKKKANALGIIPMSKKKETVQASKGDDSNTTSTSQTEVMAKNCVGDVGDNKVGGKCDSVKMENCSVNIQTVENDGNVNTCESRTEDRKVPEKGKGQGDTGNVSASEDDKKQSDGVKTAGSDGVKPAGLGGLGLLGAYSDSESDTSD